MLTRHDVALSTLSTLHLGGPAGTLLEPETEAELVAAVREHPGAFVLGGGSNVVLPDHGLEEVVLVRTRGVSRDGDLLEVQAGEDWDALVARTVDEGLVGLEALSGIPGTVGAAPIQNIGAYGAEVASCVVGVRTYDRASGVVSLTPTDCRFSYRHSAFKAEPGRWVVLAVQLRLGVGTLSAPVRYAELARALGIAVGECAPAAQVREAVLALRRNKGMVLDAEDPDSVSAGSFFTNPIVPSAPAGAPSWPDADGGVKVSAAWLIEQAGFPKGWGDGRVGLSSKHTLALVNRGGATTEELIGVARRVRDGVRDRFGITLVPEPVVVGSHRSDPLTQ